MYVWMYFIHTYIHTYITTQQLRFGKTTVKTYTDAMVPSKTPRKVDTFFGQCSPLSCYLLGNFLEFQPLSWNLLGNFVKYQHLPLNLLGNIMEFQHLPTKINDFLWKHEIFFTRICEIKHFGIVQNRPKSHPPAMLSAWLESLNQVSENARATFIKLQSVIFHMIKSDFLYVVCVWQGSGLPSNSQISWDSLNGP